MAESGEKFAEHFLRGHDLGTFGGHGSLSGRPRAVGPLVGKGDPVEGIGENPPHCGRSLGRAVDVMVVLLGKVGGQGVPTSGGSSGSLPR